MTSSTLIHSVASTTAHRDRDDLDVSIAQLLVEFLHAKSTTIYRVIDDNGIARVACRVAAIRGLPGYGSDNIRELANLPTLHGDPAWRECVHERRPVEYIAQGGGPHTIFPIESEHGVVGMLDIEPRHILRQRDQALIGGILRIIKNHLALLDYGECDSLTGLMNRKTFETSFYKQRSLRAKDAATSAPSWLGLLDIDRFKSINDNYGHLFGDEMLLLLARVMKQTFRGADQLFRFGGEEFVVVLDRATVAGANIEFERLRAAIDNYVFPQIGNITISLGFTRIDPRDAPSTCVERADAALYFAKQHGRNNVRSYEALVAAGELNVGNTEAKDSVELF